MKTRITELFGAEHPVSKVIAPCWFGGNDRSSSCWRRSCYEYQPHYSLGRIIREAEAIIRPASGKTCSELVTLLNLI